MKPDAHLVKIEESRRMLKECVEQGVAANQVTIGFHSAFLACNMFELYLHNARLIDFSTHVKHEWLGSKRKIRERFPFPFPGKEELLDLLYSIEKARDILCYGNPQPEEVVMQQVERVRAMERIFKELAQNEA